MTRSSAVADGALAQGNEDPASAASRAPSPEVKKITVQTKSGEFTYECATGEPLLYAGLRHGLALPYECATGTCGTCRGRIMSGEAEVAWDAAPGAARLKRDKGDVLMCQARPRSDCLVRVPAEVQAKVCGPDTPAHRQGTIRNLRRLTHDVIHFEAGLSSPVTFEAGQFVVLGTPEVPGGRAYSMVNYARGTQSLDLVIKRMPGGGFSEWIFGRDIDGAEIEVFGPLGCATFHPEEDRNLLLIAGGSGIAGMMSILERARGQDYFRDHKGHVFFGVRTLADGFYLDELTAHAAAAKGNLEVTLALSHEPAPAAAHPEFPAIGLAEGMVHEVASKAMANSYDDVIGFTAGPPPMVDAVLRVLIVDGMLTPESIRYDKFA